jgi:hypothetical protein
MLILSPWLAVCLPALQTAPDSGVPSTPAANRAAVSFHAPVRLSASDGPLAVEAPGYAAPTWYDLDGDGLRDLIVGQFKNGQLKVYRQLGRGETGLPRLAEGTWLQAGGEVAQVPGVW